MVSGAISAEGAVSVGSRPLPVVVEHDAQIVHEGRVWGLKKVATSEARSAEASVKLALPFMAVGAEGVISVASNIIPRQITRMVNAFTAGNADAALRLHQKYYPMFKDLFIETNPVPTKAALAMLGRCAEEYRLPLCKMSAANRAQLARTLKACGVLKK